MTCDTKPHADATVDALGYLEEPFRPGPCVQAATYRLLLEHRVGGDMREVLADMQAKPANRADDNTPTSEEIDRDP